MHDEMESELAHREGQLRNRQDFYFLHNSNQTRLIPTFHYVFPRVIFRRRLLVCLHLFKFQVQGDTKKTGTFEKPNKN